MKIRRINNNSRLKNFSRDIGQKLSQSLNQRLRQKFSGNQQPDARQILLWIVLALIGLTLFAVLSLGILVAVVSIGLPDVHDLDKLSVAQSTTIYDKENNVLYVKYGGENRQYVPYEEISPHLIDATVAIEDDKYWEHPGFNTKGIFRAIINNIFHLGFEQGGSTITQQYIKKTFLSSEKSIVRKLKELILAVQLEQAFNKKKILELYLNKILYGNNAYGIEKAAQIYFNKHAKDLDLAESSILASLPNRPSYYTNHRYSSLTKQFTPGDFFLRSIRTAANLRANEYLTGLIGKTVQIGEQEIYLPGRSDLVLSRMEQLGYVNHEERRAALAEIQNITFSEYHEQIKAPHFVFYILDQLEQKYGKEIVEQGGLKVYTTLDSRLQEIAERALKEGAQDNAKKFNTKNGSLVAMDPKNGQIVAMVGSKDYFDDSVDGKENVALDYRQPGSSFKPFVYAQAFYNRYAPASVVFDTPIEFADGTTPKDFDGKFRGPMSIREALGQSRNIPAIKAYFVAGQQKAVVELAQKMGIHFLDPERDFGWTMAIGAAEVRLLDMVDAFSVFANGGFHHDPLSILKVQNAKGDTLEEWQDKEGDPVLDPQIAYLINSILSDTSVRLGQYLTISGQVNAAKTGTSNRVDKNDKKKYYPHDLWALGYTTKLVAGVWTGNNNDTRDGNLSLNADGYNVSAPIWKKFMTEALKDSPSEDFPVPDGIKQVSIASASGKLPGPTTPPDQIKSDVFASFSVPTEIDNSYTVVEIDPLCGKLANEFTPTDVRQKVAYLNQPDLAQIPQWQKGAGDWIQSHAGQTDANNASLVIGAPPTETCPQRTAANKALGPTVVILAPPSGTQVPVGSRPKVEAQVSAPLGLDLVEFYLDNKFRYRTSSAPYIAEIRLPVGEEPGKTHKITVKAFDKLQFIGEASIDIMTTP